MKRTTRKIEEEPAEPVDIIEMDDDWVEDMEKAGAVQDHLGSIPQIKGADLAIEYQPYSHIGGDFYQVVSLNEDRTFFILGRRVRAWRTSRTDSFIHRQFPQNNSPPRR